MKEIFNILLVDKEEETLFLLKDLLKTKNITIFTKDCTKESFKLILKERIDLIITNTHMPEISGFEMIEFLKKIRNIKEIPFIFFTEDTTYEQEAYSLGALDYISKNIKYKVLEAKLNIFINLLTKQKNHSNILNKNERIILKLSRAAIIGDITNTIFLNWKKSFDLISSINCNIKFKIGTNNLKDDFLGEKLNTTTAHICNIYKGIDCINSFSEYTPHETNVILGETMDSAIKIIEPILKEKKIKLFTHYYTNSDMYIFKNDIIQVFLTILKNSIDTFIGRESINPQITITIQEKLNFQIITFKDNIRNSDKTIENTVLNPDFSNPKSLTQTNIEFYICKTLIEKHYQGCILIENKEDGTHFKIILKNKKKLSNKIFDINLSG